MGLFLFLFFSYKNYTFIYLVYLFSTFLLLFLFFYIFMESGNRQSDEMLYQLTLCTKKDETPHLFLIKLTEALLLKSDWLQSCQSQEIISAS